MDRLGVITAAGDVTYYGGSSGDVRGQVRCRKGSSLVAGVFGRAETNAVSNRRLLPRCVTSGARAGPPRGAGRRRSQGRPAAPPRGPAPCHVRAALGGLLGL